jgi:hypothetical protein
MRRSKMRVKTAGSIRPKDIVHVTFILPPRCTVLDQGQPIDGPFFGMSAMLLSVSKFESSFWPRIIAPLLGGLLILAAAQNQAQAAPAEGAATSRRLYVISDHDGYGLLECLTQKRDCGKIVADSWCESHGHGPALSFGHADDVTASVAAVSSVAKRAPESSGAAVIACTE